MINVKLQRHPLLPINQGIQNKKSTVNLCSKFDVVALEYLLFGVIIQEMSIFSLEYQCGLKRNDMDIQQMSIRKVFVRLILCDSINLEYTNSPFCRVDIHITHNSAL